MNTEARYTEGDIIVVNNKFYICRVAGVEDSMFEASYLYGFHNFPYISGCGHSFSDKTKPTITIECGDTIFLPTNICHFKKPHRHYDKHKAQFLNKVADAYYPIVGKDNSKSLSSNKTGTGILLNLNLIRELYPELFEDYITFNLTKITSK